MCVCVFIIINRADKTDSLDYLSPSDTIGHRSRKVI